MGLSYSTRDAIVTLVADGDFDLDQVASAFSEICATSQPSSSVRVLIDDGGSSFTPDTPDLKALVHLWSGLSEVTPLRIALLVARRLHYGLGRMLGVFAEGRGFSFSVFSDRAAALDWLGKSGASAE